MVRGWEMKSWGLGQYRGRLLWTHQCSFKVPKRWGISSLAVRLLASQGLLHCEINMNRSNFNKRSVLKHNLRGGFCVMTINMTYQNQVYSLPDNIPSTLFKVSILTVIITRQNIVSPISLEHVTVEIDCLLNTSHFAWTWNKIKWHFIAWFLKDI